MRGTTALTLGFFFVSCAFAGSLVAGLVPEGLVESCEREVLQKKWQTSRAQDDLIEVTEARWMFLPFLLGDFDLQMDLEVSEGAEIDLLLRQVEPRRIDEELLPFAGRFSVLRLSTQGDGEGWRTREQALLGPPHNGVGIGAGHLATVWVEARGRKLRANVAGKPQPWFEADDLYGMFTMVAKGGKAVIHRLEITPHVWPSMWLWSTWTWAGFGVLAGALVAGLALLLKRPLRLLSAGITVVVVSWLLVRDANLDLAFPLAAGLWAALILSLLFGVVVIVRSERGKKLLLVPVMIIAVFAVLRDAVSWPGLTKDMAELVDDGVTGIADRVVGLAKATDSTEIDAVFGTKAGAQISEAHGLLVRGANGLLDVDRDAPCVFLLGGQRLYDLGMPSDHTALMLERQLRGTLRVPVEVPALPTVDGHSAQQWEMFDRFYWPFAPNVVVLGIGADECATEPGMPVPRSSPTQVRETIAKARKACAEHDVPLVLFADVGVTKAIMLELRAQEADGVPLVVAFEGRERIETVRKLADVCRPFLKK